MTLADDLKQKQAGAILLAISLCSLAITYFIVTPRFWIDDAFIYFRYARNLRDGFGLVFNPGESLEGYSSFLWVLISYLGLFFGEPIVFLQWVGVFSQFFILFFTYQIGLQLGRSHLQSLVAPLLLGLQATFCSYPMTGMDTTFYTMLVTLGALLFLKGYYRDPRGKWLTGIVLLSIALTRFDGLVIASIMLGYKVLIDRDIKSVLAPIAVFLGGLIVYNAWRISVYPTLLPNTFYAKVDALQAQLAGGLRYMKSYFFRWSPFVLPLSMVPFILRKTTPKIRFAVWVSVWHLIYIIYVGGDWMPHFRFLLPVLPLLFVLAQEGIFGLTEITALKPYRLILSVLIVSIFAGLSGYRLYSARNFFSLVSGSVFQPQHARDVGKHLDKTLPANYTVAVEWAGIVPYYIRQPTLDILGLTDREITALDFPSSQMGRVITTEYLLKRNPEVIVIATRTFPTHQEAAKGILHKMKVIPKGNWMKEFYSNLANPAFGYITCVMETDQKRYFPLLVRKNAPDFASICTAPIGVDMFAE